LKGATFRQHYYPEGGWGWVVAACCFIVNAFTHGIHLSFGVLQLEIVRHLQEQQQLRQHQRQSFRQRLYSPPSQPSSSDVAVSAVDGGELSDDAGKRGENPIFCSHIFVVPFCGLARRRRRRRRRPFPRPLRHPHYTANENASPLPFPIVCLSFCLSGVTICTARAPES